MCGGSALCTCGFCFIALFSDCVLVLLQVVVALGSACQGLRVCIRSRLLDFILAHMPLFLCSADTMFCLVKPSGTFSSHFVILDFRVLFFPDGGSRDDRDRCFHPRGGGLIPYRRGFVFLPSHTYEACGVLRTALFFLFVRFRT